MRKVSIPQSEFCPLGPEINLAAANALRAVSIPQSEFCPLGLVIEDLNVKGMVSFNSSVGILSVGTRNDVLSPGELIRVSIPQSEFCPLGPSSQSTP